MEEIIDMICDKIVSIELLPYEEETIDISVSGNNLFFANDILTHNSGATNSDADMTDVSECIYINETIQMKDGSTKSIGDIIPGDQITSNDSFKTVTFVHHKKTKECVRIVLKSGKSIIVSKEHVFPSSNGRLSYNDGLRIGMKLCSSI